MQIIVACLQPNLCDVEMIFAAVLLLGIFCCRVRADQSLDKLVMDLWRDDPNRLVVGKDLILNWQGSVKNRHANEDYAPHSLCTIKSPKVNQNRVYRTFVALLDNYNPEVGVSESDTPEEKKEISDFLDAVLDTSTMKKFHQFLVWENLAPSAVKEFKELLQNLWFKTYIRGRAMDSSAFEHVFVGEVKNGEVIGFHNWLTFCLLESKRSLDYHGYHVARYHEPNFKRSLRFSTHGQKTKPFGSILFGASVEFELGLYTAVFLKSRQGQRANEKWPAVAVRLGPDKIRIQCHQFRTDDIGTCFVM